LRLSAAGSGKAGLSVALVPDEGRLEAEELEPGKTGSDVRDVEDRSDRTDRHAVASVQRRAIGVTRGGALHRLARTARATRCGSLHGTRARGCVKSSRPGCGS